MSEVTGQLKVKFDTQKVSDKFQKREFVLMTEHTGPYPQYVSFQATQDKCSMLDQFKEGDEIKVQFNLRGREWSGPQGVKYFNTLEAWRLERVSGGPTTQYQDQNPPKTNPPAFNNSNDDFPF